MSEEATDWTITRPNDPLTRAEAASIVGQMALVAIKTASLAASAQFGDKEGGTKTFEELKDLMDEMVNNLAKSGLLATEKSADGE